MPSGQIPLLARHFLFRFLDNDLISPDSDVHESGALVLVFLAVPSLLGTALFLFMYANPWVTPYERMLMALPDKLMYIAWSMLVMALVTLIDWDALSLDGRDYAILGPLPIASRTLLAGKVVALALFAAAVLVAVNLVPTFFFPVVYMSSTAAKLPLPYLALLVAGHGAACVGAGIFGFLGVVAVRGLLLFVLGPRLFRRISIPVQFVGGIALIIAFFRACALQPVRIGTPVYWWPPMWFLGIYEVITAPAAAKSSGEMQAWQVTSDQINRAVYHWYDPTFHDLAMLALVALGVAVVAAVVFYFASHFRHASTLRQQSGTESARTRAFGGVFARLATRLVVRDPIARASFFFTLETLARSARHKLYVAGYLAAGVLWIYTSVVPMVARGGAGVFRTPSLPLLSTQLVLSFFLIAGLRFVFTIPAELRANWLFRVTAVGDIKRYLAGVRRAVILVVIVPFFLLLAPIHWWLWGPRVALLHAMFGMLWASVLVDVLMMGLEKLPFTCSHVSGHGNVRILWPAYIAGFAIYSYWFAGREAAAMRPDGSPASLVVFLVIALVLVAAWRRREYRRRAAFVFQDIPDSAAISLDL